MPKPKLPSRKGAEEARSRLPELLDAAERGQATIITRHGRPVAAITPIETYENAVTSRQLSLLSLAGSEQGLWGHNSTETIAALRDEWEQ